MTPEEAKEMQQRYRNVFGSEEGRIVLGDILTQAKFGYPLLDTEQMIRHNFAMEIARTAGAFDPLYVQLSMV